MGQKKVYCDASLKVYTHAPWGSCALFAAASVFTGAFFFAKTIQNTTAALLRLTTYPAYFVANARPRNRDTHSCSLNKGIRCKSGTRRVVPRCCQHKVRLLSAKAGHWRKLRRREAGVEKSECASQKTYNLCGFHTA